MKIRNAKSALLTPKEKKYQSLVEFVYALVLEECPEGFSPPCVLLSSLLNIFADTKADIKDLKDCFQSTLTAYREYLENGGE